MGGTPVIDVHAHVLLPGLQALVVDADPVGWQAAQELELARNGAVSSRVSGEMIAERWSQLTALDRRLADMDEAGVDIQVVSASPSQYYPWLGVEHAVAVARAANSAVADLVNSAPDRLRGLGLIALQHPQEAVELLHHAVRDCGLRGVQIPSSAGAVELSDPALEDFWAASSALGATIFLHPFGCTLDERLGSFYLANTVGQPVESAVALSHLILSGVLDRHPELVVVASHGGGYLPTYTGRMDHAWLTRSDTGSCSELPSSYLRRLYFDSLVHSPEALNLLVRAVGGDRVLLGSDYPFDMGVPDPVDRVGSAALDDSTVDAITSGNARRIGLGSPVTDLAPPGPRAT